MIERKQGWARDGFHLMPPFLAGCRASTLFKLHVNLQMPCSTRYGACWPADTSNGMFSFLTAWCWWGLDAEVSEQMCRSEHSGETGTSVFR